MDRLTKEEMAHVRAVQKLLKRGEEAFGSESATMRRFERLIEEALEQSNKRLSANRLPKSPSKAEKSVAEQGGRNEAWDLEFGNYTRERLEAKRFNARWCQPLISESGVPIALTPSWMPPENWLK